MNDDDRDLPEVFSQKGVRLTADDEHAILEWTPDDVAAELGYDTAQIGTFGFRNGT